MSKLAGIDVSAWQHPKGVAINWKQVKDDGVEFVIIKCSQGQTYENPYLAEDASSAHAAGLLVGAYHYAEPAAGNAELEALYAINAVRHLPLSLGIALDLEEPGSVPTYELAKWAQEFMEHINAAGHLAPLYSNHEYMTMMTGAPWGHRLWFAGTMVPTGAVAWMQQNGTRTIKGITGPVDADELLVARGVNPSHPYKAPAVARHLVEPEEPEPAANENTEPSQMDTEPVSA